jgi:hypothetical protein
MHGNKCQRCEKTFKSKDTKEKHIKNAHANYIAIISTMVGHALFKGIVFFFLKKQNIAGLGIVASEICVCISTMLKWMMLN